jgi:hypothetical protein
MKYRNYKIFMRIIYLIWFLCFLGVIFFPAYDLVFVVIAAVDALNCCAVIYLDERLRTKKYMEKYSQ